MVAKASPRLARSGSLGALFIQREIPATFTNFLLSFTELN